MTVLCKLKNDNNSSHALDNLASNNSLSLDLKSFNDYDSARKFESDCYREQYAMALEEPYKKYTLKFNGLEINFNTRQTKSHLGIIQMLLIVIKKVYPVASMKGIVLLQPYFHQKNNDEYLSSYAEQFGTFCEI